MTVYQVGDRITFTWSGRPMKIVSKAPSGMLFVQYLDDLASYSYIRPEQFEQLSEPKRDDPVSRPTPTDT